MKFNFTSIPYLNLSNANLAVHALKVN